MSILVNIASEFTGKKAFKEAETATQKLEKGITKLGKQLVGVFAVSQVVAFGKASVKAFSEDEAAAARLSSAIDNLGLSFSKVQAADFIANLERTAGIADDTLRPAFQALLTTTGSLTKSQELLNNAIQISRASGIDLATVASDLAKGYVGVTRGLQKYNTGLTKAELQSKSFSEVLGVLLARSAGAADAYLETTSYKLDVLSVAAGNAKEAIGAGLVDAFAKAGGGTSAQDAAKTFNNIAKAINGITGAIGSAIGGLTSLYRKLDDFTYNFDPIFGDSKATQDARKKAAASNRQSSPAGTAQRTKQQREAEAAAAKRAKELAALQKKQVAATKALTAEQKKQVALKKAGTVFDLEQIGLVAALKGKLSEEEKIRVQAQLALLNGNDAVATKLTNQIINAQAGGKELAAFLTSLPDANNPFKNFEAYLDAVYAAWKSKDWSVPVGNAPAPVPSLFSSEALSTPRSTGAGITSGGDVFITVQGSVVAQEDLESMVLSGLQGKSLSGSPSVIGRISGMFG